ncbi:MAG: GNAT family N-acetyltransferase, partial [Actinomycetota bacterium]|nr:GNAT family N-acetyltransferase [Actinomycetota bacterium]
MTLRPADRSDIPELVRIRRTPEVHRHWRGGDDMIAEVETDFDEPDSVAYVIELENHVVGWIQYEAEEEPDYRHASLDIYVDPAAGGRSRPALPAFALLSGVGPLIREDDDAIGADLLRLRELQGD